MNSVAPDPLVADVLRAAVAHGIDGAPAWPPHALECDAFAELLDAAATHRLLGALAEAVDDGAFALSGDQLAVLAEQHAAAQGHMLRLERMLLRVATNFDRAGIDFRVLKGTALAHLVYADPSWRIAADLDLLVPSSRFDDAVSIIVEELGGEQEVPELRSGFDREFGKEALVRVADIEVDLHRTFVTGPFGLTITLDDLFADASVVAIGDQRLLALGAEHQFLHACYNVALGDYPVRLCAVRDVLLCRAIVGPRLDSAVETARRWRAIAVVQRAAQLVVEAVGRPAAGDIADLAALVVPRRQAWLLHSYLTPARSYSRPLASLTVIAGVRPRLRYGRAILVPSRQYLASRGWTGTTHVRRALRRLSNHD